MTQEQKIKQQTDLTAEQVAKFLSASPDFFTDYPELLEQIQLHDERRGVVSLSMRQLALLRDKNEKLQNQLEGLLDIARENDALFGRMQQLTIALIDARCVKDVIATLDDLLRDCFGADFFAIRLVTDEKIANFPLSEVIWQTDSQELDSFKRLIESKKIKCGHPTHTQAKALFDEQAADVQSAAFIPLKIDDQDGLLVIGSKDADRFHPTMGNLFLSHLGELVAKRLFSFQQKDKE